MLVETMQRLRVPGSLALPAALREPDGWGIAAQNDEGYRLWTPVAASDGDWTMSLTERGTARLTLYGPGNDVEYERVA
jgi:hypothetical protein